jgi:hypothetical protein
VYVDNDPLALVHARVLLTSNPEGAIEYIDADVREPDRILADIATTLDLTQPTALVLLGILGHITDDDEAQSTVKRLMDGLAPGSYLAHCAGAPMSHETIEAHRRYNESGAIP